MSKYIDLEYAKLKNKTQSLICEISNLKDKTDNIEVYEELEHLLIYANAIDLIGNTNLDIIDEYSPCLTYDSDSKQIVENKIDNKNDIEKNQMLEDLTKEKTDLTFKLLDANDTIADQQLVIHLLSKLYTKTRV